MKTKLLIEPPIFEIGPKSYLYGGELLALARAADRAAANYNVNIIFTTPCTMIERVAGETEHLHVFAPHMDPLYPGRGLAEVLPESLVAAGAQGVMLNHCEKPLTFSVLKETIRRAKETGLLTIVCADSITEVKAVSLLGPDIVVAEPTELIGTMCASDMGYVQKTIQAVKSVNPDIIVLQGAGITDGQSVYRVIRAGAEATGSSSAIACAKDREAIVDEMVGAVRRAWDDRLADGGQNESSKASAARRG